MSDAEPEVVETKAEPEYTRVVCLENCGPSPARCLYHAGLVYNVPSTDEAAWLLSNGYAFVEGEEAPMTNQERLRAAREHTFAAEQARSQEALVTARARRKEADQAEQEAEAFFQTNAQEALLKARAARKQAKLDAVAANELENAEKLRAEREFRKEQARLAQEEVARAQEEARQRLLAARKARGK